MSDGPTARRNHARKMRFHDDVGRMVRGFRIAAGMTLREAAEFAGITPTTLGAIEHGTSTCPLYVAAMLAEAFDCTLDDLAPVTLDDKEESAAE